MSRVALRILLCDDFSHGGSSASDIGSRSGALRVDGHRSTGSAVSWSVTVCRRRSSSRAVRVKPPAVDVSVFRAASAVALVSFIRSGTRSSISASSVTTKTTDTTKVLASAHAGPPFVVLVVFVVALHTSLGRPPVGTSALRASPRDDSRSSAALIRSARWFFPK